MGKKRRVAFNGSPIFEAHEKFRFSCHAGLPCYNRCCRDISIFLSPYDVVRMKNRLGLDSGSFLRNYATRLTTRTGLFLVRLNMREEDDLKCHFVTPQGCRIYPDRPWACRMAPIDINNRGEYHFIFNDSHCIGLKETPEWTVETWMEDQGLVVYQELESVFRDLPSRIRFTGMPTLDRHIAEMYYMVCYDLDRFRKYIFETSFLTNYAVPAQVADRIRTDDVELMKYGFTWLSDGVDVDKTIEIRDQVS
ncbi:MAG: YkgJ family cysteine cluster protein [Candidatus Desulforudis sp.]|nr:YkgJ family cysteine cluster protein [Desulforudis sp.]